MATDSLAGYSGTPLAKKLGITEGGRVRLVNAPAKLPEALQAHAANFTNIEPGAVPQSPGAPSFPRFFAERVGGHKGLAKSSQANPFE